MDNFIEKLQSTYYQIYLHSTFSSNTVLYQQSTYYGIYSNQHLRHLSEQLAEPQPEQDFKNPYG